MVVQLVLGTKKQLDVDVQKFKFNVFTSRKNLCFEFEILKFKFEYLKRTFNSLGEGIFRLVGCSDVLVPVGIKVRVKTQPIARL